MPSIPISNGLSVTADAQLAPWSALAQYAQDFPKLVASGADLSRWQVLTLSDPAVQSLDTGLALEHPIPLGNGAPALTLGEDAAIHFEVLTDAMFSPDVYGDNIAILPRTVRRTPRPHRRRHCGRRRSCRRGHFRPGRRCRHRHRYLPLLSQCGACAHSS